VIRRQPRVDEDLILYLTRQPEGRYLCVLNDAGPIDCFFIQYRLSKANLLRLIEECARELRSMELPCA